MAATAPLSMRPQQQTHNSQHQHRSSAPININVANLAGTGQGPYRMSFSPTNEREYQHSQQQPPVNSDTYSGIVGGAARSIFGSSDDEAYLPNHPEPRAVYSDHQRQQFLAHERLASIAERGVHQTATPPNSGSMLPNPHPHPHPQHQQQSYTPLMQQQQTRPSVPPFTLELQTGIYSGSGLPSPIHPSPIGGSHNWTTAIAGKRV